MLILWFFLCVILFLDPVHVLGIIFGPLHVSGVLMANSVFLENVSIRTSSTDAFTDFYGKMCTSVRWRESYCTCRGGKSRIVYFSVYGTPNPTSARVAKNT